MSFSSLGIGASALNAASRAVEVAAHNVANSTVEGYTRQRLNTATAAPTPGTNGMRGSGMRGNGVEVISIERLRSAMADIGVRSEASAAGSAGAKAEVLDRAQGVLGPYGAGLPNSLDKLWAAFGNLSTAPGSEAARRLTLDAADTVTTGIRDASSQLTQIRADATVQITGGVQAVNDASKEVANLNGHIFDALALGQAPNDLLDRRDLALDKLAALTGATSQLGPTGMVTVKLNGQTLVSGKTATAMTQSAVPPPAGYVGDDVALQVGGVAVTAAGELGGRVSALQIDLRAEEKGLNDFTKDLLTQVNDEHGLGYDTAGNPGGSFFTGTDATNIAVDPKFSDPTVARPFDRLAAAGTSTGGSLDGNNAGRLAALSSPAGGKSPGERVQALAATLGSRASSAASAADAADAALDGVREQRETANGVSIDEEMVDLVKFQHSYEAAARVISMADNMLDTIINRMGAGR